MQVAPDRLFSARQSVISLIFFDAETAQKAAMNFNAKKRP
jgi:hypothetical protein